MPETTVANIGELEEEGKRSSEIVHGLKDLIELCSKRTITSLSCLHTACCSGKGHYVFILQLQINILNFTIVSHTCVQVNT